MPAAAPSQSPLARKLIVKPGYRLGLLNAPEGYLTLLKPLPDGAEVVEVTSGDLDFVQVFARDMAQVDQLLPAARAALKPSGLLWVCYPKGTSGVKTDLNRDILHAHLLELGLTGVSMVAVDATWSAMRYKL